MLGASLNEAAAAAGGDAAATVVQEDAGEVAGRATTEAATAQRDDTPTGAADGDVTAPAAADGEAAATATAGGSASAAAPEGDAAAAGCGGYTGSKAGEASGAAAAATPQSAGRRVSETTAGGGSFGRNAEARSHGDSDSGIYSELQRENAAANVVSDAAGRINADGGIYTDEGESGEHGCASLSAPCVSSPFCSSAASSASLGSSSSVSVSPALAAAPLPAETYKETGERDEVKGTATEERQSIRESSSPQAVAGVLVLSPYVHGWECSRGELLLSDSERDALESFLAAAFEQQRKQQEIERQQQEEQQLLENVKKEGEEHVEDSIQNKAVENREVEGAQAEQGASLVSPVERGVENEGHYAASSANVKEGRLSGGVITAYPTHWRFFRIDTDSVALMGGSSSHRKHRRGGGDAATGLMMGRGRAGSASGGASGATRVGGGKGWGKGVEWKFDGETIATSRPPRAARPSSFLAAAVGGGDEGKGKGQGIDAEKGRGKGGVGGAGGGRSVSPGAGLGGGSAAGSASAASAVSTQAQGKQQKSGGGQSEAWMHAFHEVLVELCRQPVCLPFFPRVSAADAHYAELSRKVFPAVPITLETVLDRLEKQEYARSEEVFNDVYTVFLCAFRYYEPGNQYWLMAQEASIAFEKLVGQQQGKIYSSSSSRSSKSPNGGEGEQLQNVLSNDFNAAIAAACEESGGVPVAEGNDDEEDEDEDGVAEAAAAAARATGRGKLRGLHTNEGIKGRQRKRRRSSRTASVDDNDDDDEEDEEEEDEEEEDDDENDETTEENTGLPGTRRRNSRRRRTRRIDRTRRIGRKKNKDERRYEPAASAAIPSIAVEPSGAPTAAGGLTEEQQTNSVTFQEREAFQQLLMQLDTDVHLQLYSVFKERAMWLSFETGEVELDDGRTPPEVFREMVAWCRQRFAEQQQQQQQLQLQQQSPQHEPLAQKQQASAVMGVGASDIEAGGGIATAAAPAASAASAAAPAVPASPAAVAGDAQPTAAAGSAAPVAVFPPAVADCATAVTVPQTLAPTVTPAGREAALPHVEGAPFESTSLPVVGSCVGGVTAASDGNASTAPNC